MATSVEDPQIVSYYPRKKNYYPNPKKLSKAPINYIYLSYNDTTIGSNFVTAFWDYRRDWNPDTSKWNKDGTPKKTGKIYTKKFTIEGVKNQPKKAYEQIKDIKIKWYYRTKNDTDWKETEWTSVFSKSSKKDDDPLVNPIPDFDPAKDKIPWKYSYAGREILDLSQLQLQPGDEVQDIKFGFKVWPEEYVSDKKGTVKRFWTGPIKADKSEEYTTAIINTDSTLNDYYPDVPTVSVSVTGNQLTATVTLDDDDLNTKKIRFYLFDKETESELNKIEVSRGGIGAGNVLSAAFTISYAKNYIVRAKAINDELANTDYGILESDFSDPVEVTSDSTPPPSIGDPDDGSGVDYSKYIPEISEASYSYRDQTSDKTYVNLSWSGPGEYRFTIQYTPSKYDFDSSGGNVTSIETEKNVFERVIGPLESGNIYYFRIAAKNDKGTGSWSKIWSIAIGDKPDVPNIGVDNNIFDYNIGEMVKIWWVHQSVDGSKEKSATVYLNISDKSILYKIANAVGGSVVNEKVVVTIDKSLSDKTTMTTWNFRLFSNIFTKDTTINISVKTTSTLGMTSDLSSTISIRCWTIAHAYLNLYMRNHWLWDPFNFKIDDVYTALGDFKIEDMIEDNTVRQFPFYVLATVDPTIRKIIDYTLTVTAKGDYQTVNTLGEDVYVHAGDEIWSSAMTKHEAHYVNETNSLQFYFLPSDIRLEDGQTYEINFIASLNNGKTAIAESYEFTVELDSISYVLDADLTYNEDDVSATIQPYCYDYSGNLVPNVFVSVYREDYYGKFIKIAENLNNMFNTTVKDPHPTLRQVKYRVVGIDITTGTVFYEDLPLFEIPETAIIIQWDEKWKNFDSELEKTVTFNGSLLKLPYNISTVENPVPEVELVEYIGRESPVSYYGTQIEERSSWQTVIPRYDTETLYGLRRLAKYKGNAYVREPNGTGYLANVNVSFSIENLAVTIPITLTVTRVEE